jgi:inositol-pentakisphosphate 2-kinase
MDADNMSQPHVSSYTCPSAIAEAELELHYLAEGAANIIYSVTVKSPPSLQHHANCCVMRLRKDLPFTKPATEVMADFQQKVNPLFEGNHAHLLLEQALCNLNPEMITVANAELKRLDAVDLSIMSAEGIKALGKRVRLDHRRHVYLPSFDAEQYGILMQNLQGPSVDYLIEFKPKWLVQSPSAPKVAKNCRTCALNAMRRKEAKHKGRGDSGFCPWDLLAVPEDSTILANALTKIWPIDVGIDSFVAEFQEKVQPALQHLRKLQQDQNAVGLFDFQDPEGKEFGVSMALRDSSVFMALKRHVSDVQLTIVDVKFGDLDLKSSTGGKIENWAAMEEKLISEGWYSIEGTSCALSRGIS